MRINDPKIEKLLKATLQLDSCVSEVFIKTQLREYIQVQRKYLIKQSIRQQYKAPQKSAKNYISFSFF